MNPPDRHTPADAPRNELVGGERARITRMAEIPRLAPGELDRLNIVHSLMKESSLLDAFQRLFRGLAERAYGKNFVVGVRGIVPGAGSTFVSLNLAAAIAIDHHRTAMLIEGAPDNPLTDTLLMLTPDFGLADYLSDPGMDAEAIIYSSRIPRVRVVPWGQDRERNPTLNCPAMQRMLEGARARYSDRFVVLDIPGSASPDTLGALARWCDFILLVVPYGQVTAGQIRAVADEIGRDRVAGVVLNRDPAR